MSFVVRRGAKRETEHTIRRYQYWGRREKSRAFVNYLLQFHLLGGERIDLKDIYLIGRIAKPGLYIFSKGIYISGTSGDQILHFVQKSFEFGHVAIGCSIHCYSVGDFVVEHVAGTEQSLHLIRL